MQHRVHKFKFSSGKGANDMLLRKLVVNFLEHGSMVTTEKKGKALSSYMDKIVQKAKNRSEANKNYLLSKVGSEKTVATLFEKVGPVFKDVNGGYLSLKRLQQRVSDGAMMVKLSWGKAVVLDEPSTKDLVKPSKQPKTEAGANVASPAEKKTKKTPVKKAKTVKKSK
jgi:large subunit ribosomal protein L17